MYKNSLLSLLSLAATATAWNPPQYGGYALIWSDNFSGGGGSSPNQGNWNIINGKLNVNGELETYTSSTRNVQLSGGDTLQIVPWRDSGVNGGWTSGRLESRYVWTAQPGEITRIESQLRFGGNNPGNKQGIWPAWWALGDSIRHGKPWPGTGELDVMETVDGRLTGYGTVHCDVYPGGICNEGNGIGGSIGIPNQDWHTWRLEVDRRDGNWVNQAIRWYMDGQLYHQVTGSRINNFNVWQSLTAQPFYFLLNVAVGGSWPGYPDGNTLDGYGSMMEVAYVAHYST